VIIVNHFISDRTFTVLDYMGNMADVIYETGTVYPLRLPGWVPCFPYGVNVFATYLLSFMCGVLCFVYLPSVFNLACAPWLSVFSNIYLHIRFFPFSRITEETSFGNLTLITFPRIFYEFKPWITATCIVSGSICTYLLTSTGFLYTFINVWKKCNLYYLTSCTYSQTCLVWPSKGS
jgi:hypothetical protein